MTPQALRERLLGGGELALLDVREQGVHYLGHPFFACSAPLSRLELRIGELVPRRDAPIVVLDGGGENLAARAQARLGELGYANVAILEGGCARWKAEGGELFRGVNVPSKAFGEFIEHEYGTPRITPGELKELQQAGKVVIVDSRPFNEYRRMNIPGGIDMPGAELVYRVHDLAPDPETMVVVNCAGRTRSIIGCQSLRNAGIPNPVVALKDGTMGWQLAGFECEHGAARVAPPPGAEGARKARERAEGVAQRFKVGFVSFEELKRMEQDKGRTLYLLDVRSREEFEERRLAGSRHAPGGQLVQATDEYVGVRNSRLVLVDPARVRSVMTASWLLQMGWKDVHVLEPEGEDGFGGRATEAGPGRMSAAVRMFPHTVSVDGLKESRSTIIDLSTSLHFRSRHIPGAWWAVRARLDEAKPAIAKSKTGTDHDFPQSLVLTSEDGLLAHLAAPEAAALWPQAQLRVLEGGNAAWFAAGLPIETGLQRLSTANNDLWYKPYDHRTDFEKHAREYLSWEVDLAEQIKRDPAVRFYRPDPT